MSVPDPFCDHSFLTHSSYHGKKIKQMEGKFSLSIISLQLTRKLVYIKDAVNGRLTWKIHINANFDFKFKSKLRNINLF